ncbi:MAG TPA: YggT family protein [Baekduia sp.]|nr:YggT family protein [Baekduia sp.]
MFVFADVRGDIADYVRILALVYTALIFVHILVRMAFQFGARIPYSMWSRSIFDFLNDVVEPYLRVFRRFIPMIGPLDISPIVAIFLLQIVAGIVAGAIAG